MDINKRLENEGLKGYSAKKIAKRVKNEEHLDKAMKAMKIADSFLEDIYTDSEKNIFNHTVTPKTLITWADDRMEGVKQQFKPYGLTLPFPDYESACSWMVKESFEGVLSTPRIMQPTYDGKELSEKQIVDEYGYVLLKEFELCMPYKYYEEGKIVSLRCQRSPFLLTLRSTINSIAIYTGFNEISLLKYFFCDIEPVLNRIIVKSDFHVGHRFIFEVNVNDAARDEFLDIYKLYRNETKKTHKKRLSQEMVDFFLFIEKQNLPLEMHKKNDYEELIEKYISEYPHKRNEWITVDEKNREVLNWRKMKMMYKRYLGKKQEEKIELGYLKYITK